MIKFEEKPNTLVLHYGTRWRIRPRHMLAAILVVALALVVSWWGQGEVKRWIGNRHARAMIRREVDQQLSQAEHSMESDHWSVAQLAIDRARFAANITPNLFGAAELKATSRRIDRAQATLEKSMERKFAETYPDPALAKRIEGEYLHPVRIRSDAIEDLNNTAYVLVQQGDDTDALAPLREVIRLDQSDQRANFLLNLLSVRPVQNSPLAASNGRLLSSHH